MRICTVVFTFTIIVPLTLAGDERLGRCRTSDSCSQGSQCVDGYCVLCGPEPSKCFRSVERCWELGCAKDEGCYITDVVVDADKGQVASKLACAKKDPCTENSVICDNGPCINAASGNRPPVALCIPDPPEDPCRDKKHSDSGKTCFVRAALCLGYPCYAEAVFIDENDCKDCNPGYQFCDIKGTGGNLKGSCTNFADPYPPDHRGRRDGKL